MLVHQRVINHRILWTSPALGRGPSPYRPWDRPLHRRNWCSKRAFRWWFMVNLVNSIVFWRHNFVWAGMVVFLVLSKVAIFLPCQTYLILVILGGHHVMFGNGMPATRLESCKVAREIILYFFFYDFDMFLLRFCYDFIMVDFTFFLPLLKTLMISICFFYGLGASHFLLMKFVMAGPIFFVKKWWYSFFCFFKFLEISEFRISFY